MTDDSEVFDEGFNAYTDGLDLDDNPYPEDTAQWISWTNGWMDKHESNTTHNDYDEYD